MQPGSRLRTATYVRAAVKLRYSPDDPPPLDPPPGLHLPNPGLWRVASQWWRDHQPDYGGRFCRHCFRWYPCDGALSAEDVLATLVRQATARGRATVLYPKARDV